MVQPDVVVGLLEKSGSSQNIMYQGMVPGGRNNKVFRIDTASGAYAAKQYRRDGDWDRLAAESRFLRFCEMAGIGGVPRLLAEDAENGVALHSWAPGKCLSGEDVTGALVRKAGGFFGSLFQARSLAGTGDGPPPARDACLCLEDYFRSPRERIAVLAAHLEADRRAPFAGDGLTLVRERLEPLWSAVCHEALTRLWGKDLLQPFPKHRLLYSPSDFGFHNALLGSGGELTFVDFEYAGIDDPAKAVCDFICQADYPVPPGSAGCFAEFCRDSGDPGVVRDVMERVETVLPLVRVKFVCIILNIFLAECGDGAAAVRRRQLEKAGLALDRIDSGGAGSRAGRR